MARATKAKAAAPEAAPTPAPARAKEVSAMTCGFCASAPLSRERELAHLRCRGTDCLCARLKHQPDSVVRDSQSKFNKISIADAVAKDIGLQPATLEWAQRYTDMGTQATIAGVQEARTATAEYERNKPKPEALRALLIEQGVEAKKAKGLDASKLIAMAVERRAYAAARALMAKRDEKAVEVVTNKQEAVRARQEQGEEARMATATKTRTTTTKKSSGNGVSRPMAKDVFRVGQVLTANKSFHADTPIGVLKVNAGDQLKVTKLEDRVVTCGRQHFSVGLLQRLTSGGKAPAKSAAAKSSPKKATTKKPVKKPAAKKATTKAPAKKATAKKTTKRR